MRAPAMRRRARQRGTVVLMVAALLPVILAMVGIGQSVAQLFNRKAQLQDAADAAALAAAAALQATPGLFPNAVAAATTLSNRYDNMKPDKSFTFSSAAVRFAASPGASTWLDASAAQASGLSSTLKYVRIDTASSANHATIGTVAVVLLNSLQGVLAASGVPATVSVSTSAVAGPLGAGVGLYQ